MDDAAKEGSLSIRIGLGWAKSHSFTTGQCPVMRYHRGLMQMILNDRAQIAEAVNATVITLDEAPQGYKDFDSGRRQEVRPQPERPDPRPEQLAEELASPLDHQLGLLVDHEVAGVGHQLDLHVVGVGLVAGQQPRRHVAVALAEQEARRHPQPVVAPPPGRCPRERRAGSSDTGG